jgi:hypothetical protein
LIVGVRVPQLSFKKDRKSMITCSVSKVIVSFVTMRTQMVERPPSMVAQDPGAVRTSRTLLWSWKAKEVWEIIHILAEFVSQRNGLARTNNELEMDVE